MRNEHLTFDEWFDMFTKRLVQLGYYESVDQRRFVEWYENEVSPAVAAKRYVHDADR